MRQFVRSLLTVTAVLLAFSQTSGAQGMGRSGSVVVPQSSIERPGDIGVRFHTNIALKVVQGSPEQGLLKPNLTPEAPPFADFAFETPASLGCLSACLHDCGWLQPQHRHRESDRRLEIDRDRRRLRRWMRRAI